MKKSLFIVAAVSAMVLTGCSKSETIATEFDQPKAISFDLFQHKATKTDVNVTTESNLTDVKISCYTTNASDNKYKADFFTNKDLAKSGSPAAWQTTPVYYWPQTTWGTSITEKLNFFAANTTIAEPSNTAGSALAGPTISYAGEQTDIVAASALNQAYDEHDGVGLTFNHILSQITLKAKGEDEGFTYQVTSISIGGGLNNTQTYTIGTGWTGAASGSETYTYGSLTTSTPYNTPTQIGDVFVALPQTTANQTISVTYNVKDSNNNTIFNGTKTNTDVDVAWVDGKKYTYILTLPSDAKKITYTVSVDDWTDGSPASTNISF